jgi:uncharacterized membrane-anchored protein
MRLTNITAAWILGASLALPAWAQEPEAAEAPAEQAAEGEEAAPEVNFNYQTGDIVLPNKVATLHLGEKYRYMPPEEANKLLQIWGNLPDETTQGAVVPADVEPLHEGGWAVFLNYVDEGHIDDSDANEIDYKELLQNMKEGEKEANEQRKAAGYDTLSLVGWAEAPHYDATSKKMYWAKEIAAGSGGEHALNYDVRVLGREGVLSMEAVAPMSQLAQVRRDMEPLIGVAEFNEGFRYAEFNAKTDRMAEYGLGALIAGAAATKLGLFGKLIALLLAFKKVVIAAVIGLFALVAKMFGKKKDEAA